MLNKNDLYPSTLPDPDKRTSDYKKTNAFQKPIVMPRDGKITPGWIEGALIAKKLQAEQNADARAQGMLDIAGHEDRRSERSSLQNTEKFGWQRQDREKEQFIQQGMGQAYQTGGYSAVIDFLGANDPKRAMSFQKDKLALDADIMSNQVMQATVPAKLAGAMAESYGILGKMGYALLNAPEKDRENMYQQMLPIIKTVNPKASDALDQKAVGMFMLAASQALPASQLYSNKRQELTSNSALGKLDIDIRSRMNNGETVENSPALRGMVEEFKSHQIKIDLAKEKINDLELNKMMGHTQSARNAAQANSAKFALTASMNSKLQSESKDFITFNDQKSTFEGAMDAISNGGGGAAQTAAYRTVAMMFNKGALSDPDVAAFANSDNTILAARKKLQSVDSPDGIVALNPTEIQRLRVLVDSIFDRKMQKQQKVNARYKGMAKKFGVDEKDLSIYEPESPDIWLNPNVPAAVAEEAKAAVAKGAPKDAVAKRVMEIMKQQDPNRPMEGQQGAMNDLPPGSQQLAANVQLPGNMTRPMKPPEGSPHTGDVMPPQYNPESDYHNQAERLRQIQSQQPGTGQPRPMPQGVYKPIGTA